MNIIFFGSAHFALPSLKALLNKGFRISCVVTQPDRKKGRGLTTSETVIKKFAQEAGIPVLTPEEVNSSETIEALRALKPDLFVVIAYGQILSQQLLDVPKIMPVNIHGSLLPLYRGAAPISRALINGEQETGNTAIKMSAGLDSGPVILQNKCPIADNDTFFTLEEKLSLMAAELLIDTLTAIKNKKYMLIDQDEEKKTLAPKLTKEDGLIKWGNSSNNIYNQIRGCLGWPDAFTHYKGKLLKIFKARVIDKEDSVYGNAPGEIINISKEGIAVSTAKGVLLIEELQLEGKRRMTAGEFISGHKIRAGDSFESK